ncbi:hypothetical protein [Bacillus sp. T33-2]|uniref:hypothetical protein n=1 Tax=Bacillus sp. T33-2 TaxID=2054168 RepID=UPI0015E0C440|nr:hypothetical protein [Bacillus sp. T33-2]
MTKVLKLIPRAFIEFIFLVAGLNGYFVIFEREPFIATSPKAMALFEFQYLLIFEKSLGIICDFTCLNALLAKACFWQQIVLLFLPACLPF